MPDNTITLKDIYEKLIKIEAMLEKVGLTAGNTMGTETDEVSPFFNPETKLYDIGYYRETLEGKDRERK